MLMDLASRRCISTKFQQMICIKVPAYDVKREKWSGVLVCYALIIACLHTVLVRTPGVVTLATGGRKAHKDLEAIIERPLQPGQCTDHDNAHRQAIPQP